MTVLPTAVDRHRDTSGILGTKWGEDVDESRE